MRPTYATLALLALLAGSTSQAHAFANPAPVVLLTAGDFTILAKTGITTVGTTQITGDIGVSPSLATSMTGFSQTMDVSNQFSTSIYVSPTGKLYAPDYAAPTPTKMTQAVSDMEAAYTNAAGRAADATGYGTPPGSIGGLTFVRGVYYWSTNVDIAANIFISGTATDVFIFQIAGNLDISSNIQVILSGGALAENIFWQVAGNTTLQTDSVMNGTILCMTGIVMQNGATLNGKALAQTNTTLIGNTVTSAAAPPPSTPGPTATASPSPSPSPTASPSPSPTAGVTTATPTPSSTASPSPSSTRTITPTLTVTTTHTPGNTSTSTVTPVSTASATPVSTASATPGSTLPGGTYIYPSPARGELATVVYDLKEGGEVSLKIHNQTGRLVDIIRDVKPAGWQSSTVSVGKFASGTYYYVIYVKLSTGAWEAQAPRKFVVLH